MHPACATPEDDHPARAGGQPEPRGRGIVQGGTGDKGSHPAAAHWLHRPKLLIGGLSIPTTPARAWGLDLEDRYASLRLVWTSCRDLSARSALPHGAIRGPRPNVILGSACQCRPLHLLPPSIALTAQCRPKDGTPGAVDTAYSGCWVLAAGTQGANTIIESGI
jgi:hypothetical protein